MIHYYSTNKQSPDVTFQTALFQGLAPDGGLYYPTYFPQFEEAEIKALHGASLQAVGFAVLDKWFGAEIDADALQQLATDAQNFPIPLEKVGPYHILEVSHGPTQAFKDVAAQNLSRLMSHFLQQRQEKVIVLVATSGDTGGAIAHGFSNVPNIDVFVLYPKGRVSELQEEQLTRVADNIHPLEIDGYFDDCQAMVKQAFNDPELADLPLTSANSISIGRLIPQIIYYAYAYAQLGRDDIEFVVPSGNFGNLTAGLFAAEMGLPFHSFIAATNKNDAAVRYLQNGQYDPRETIATLSNAMDVGNPSNFARVLELCQHDVERFRQIIQAYSISDEVTVQTMKAVQAEYNYLLDPHTAVGWRVAEDHADSEKETVIISTASPIKFASEIERTAGIQVDNQAAIARLQQRPARKTILPNDYEAVKQQLISSLT
ncbi:MAG: threonine synthase [Chloroflexota bacterium]